MALYSWLEQGLIELPEYQLPLPSQHVPQFTYNPFPYLPPELIVSILSETPADSIPSLDQTNHFFHLHIEIYKHQLIKLRTQKFPQQILTEYTSIHAIDFESIHNHPAAWNVLSKFEQKANICLSLEQLFPPNFKASARFYRAFLRHWESRRTMFFAKEQWDEALLDRFHIYEDCSRSEICDIVHLQMLYRNLLATLPWEEILPGDMTVDSRVHWSLKSDMYRNIVDQIIGCGPEFILTLLYLPSDVSVRVLRECVARFELADTRVVRYCCFDDVLAKLLTRLDGGIQIATRWQEEESYFDVCGATNWFCEGDARLMPFRNRFV